MNVKDFINNLTPKKKNIIVTSIIGVVGLLLGVLTSVNFVKATNYEVKYGIREDLIEVEHISDYSPSIKGTEGDSAIYKNVGTKNSVLVSKTNYKTLSELEELNLCIDNERFEYEPFENGKSMLIDDVDGLDKVSTTDGTSAVKAGTYSGFICSYENAKTIVKNNSELVISDVEVELLPKILVLGGTHPYEASGYLTATMLLENIQTERGVFYIITEANKSGFNYDQEVEARTQTFQVPLKDMDGNVTGYRTFKMGARYAHTTCQWPNPDMYVHPSGQTMANVEGKNLNRVYPGLVDGNFTERVAYGITQLVLQNNITLVVDLHEASPEYYPNNAVVYHNDTGKLWNEMKKNYLRPIDQETGEEGRRIYMSNSESVTYTHGLSHRELGDYTNAYVILCESNDTHEGRLHGALTSDLVTYYENNDKFYEYVKNNPSVQKYFKDWQDPVSIDERVARHTLSIESFIGAYNSLGMTQRTEYGDYVMLDESLRHSSSENNYTGELIVNNIPCYTNIIQYSVGAYLLDVE